MRTISVNVYQIDELSEKAIDKAHDKFRYEMDYPFHYENERIMMLLEEELDVKIVDWQYDDTNYDFNLRIHPSLLNLYGNELKQFLIDNFGKYMTQEKELAGYYLDMDFFFHMKNLIEKINNNVTYMDVMYNLFSHLFEAMVNDVENFYSRENFIELALLNEWEFYENGDML